MKACNICKREVEKYISTEAMDQISCNDFYNNNSKEVCLECLMREYKTKTLYHLSLEPAVVDLYPRIPKNRKTGEDEITPRICVSSSIDGCLSAVPWGGVRLEEIFNEEESALIRVYEFDVDDVGIENIIPPDYLFQTDLVRDAYENDEHWIMKDAKPSRSYLIKLINYEEDNVDDFSYEDILKMKKGGDCIDPGSYGTIVDAEYELVPEECYSRHYYIYSEIVQPNNHFDLSTKKGFERWGDAIVRNIKNLYPSDYVFFDGLISKDKSANNYILDGVLLFDGLVFDNRNIDNAIKEGLMYAKIV